MRIPQDWATIYDVAPLYAQGLDGTGQSVAVLGRVGVALSDVRTFRTRADLPPNDPRMIVNPTPASPMATTRPNQRSTWSGPALSPRMRP
jgi:subtilase family serine protease